MDYHESVYGVLEAIDASKTGFRDRWDLEEEYGEEAVALCLGENPPLVRILRRSDWEDLFLTDAGRGVLARHRLSRRPASGEPPAQIATETLPKPEEKPDDKSFRLAKEVCELFGFDSHAELRRFLKAHQEVRTRRPKTKEGKDDPHKLEVHIGDVAEARGREKQIDPLDLPAEKIDQAIEDIAERKAEIDARRRPPEK